ncbi:MAG TPA: anthranilate synthase component I family protein, partial [Bacillota bacterium]
HELTLVAPTRPSAAPDPRLTYEDARDRLGTALRRLAAGVGGGRPIPLDGAPARIGEGGDPDGPARVSNLDREAFTAAVRRALEYIAAGDVFQVVLSRRLSFPLPGDPFDLYRAYRVVSPSPYMFFLRFDAGTALLGASPELLVRVDGRRVLTRPLAGTRPRGASAEQDLALERELLADEKERAEHIMLVDLGRNDVGRVSRFGSVRVERLLYVERYSHVMHLASDVVGELADGCDAVDALAACFPAGTLSGAPKVRAMEIIAELEPVARGPYGGVVGYLGYDGNLDMCIAIRTVLAHRGRAHLQVGAGIVADSDPDREFAETENKARSALRAVELAARIGTGVLAPAAPGGEPL